MRRALADQLAGVLLASWLVAAPDSFALAAELKAVPGPNRTMTIVLADRIVAGDAARFSSLLYAAARSGPVTAITLNSPGGSIADAIQIAQAVHDSHIGTRVTNGAICASACFVIFAAARQKFAEPGARIGIHSASVPDGMELDPSATNSPSRNATAAMAATLQFYGVPDWVIGTMATTPPNHIAWLSINELRSIGVTVPQTAAVSRRGHAVP